MRFFAGAAGLAFVALLQAAPATAATPIVGAWASTQNWDNQAAGLYFTLQITADGHVHERVMNHQGMAYDMFGTYRLAGSTLQWKYTDYAPRKLCIVAGGPCQAMRAPEPLGVSHTATIRFNNANMFTGTGSDGTTMIWVRTR